MAKQLNVNLSFTADTEKAKKQIEDLQKTLSDIAKLPGKGGSLFDDATLNKASQAALELQQHLNAAVNVKTGNLDLSRFSTSIKASGKDLKSYISTLKNIGPQGQQAFLQLAKSISTAEAPVARVNAKLAEMGVTLKNAARWQISSSILHGFMGSIQSAYGYAKDLNESLNNIRIVTGASIQEMDAFAQKANKAAQALNTTTTAYTDAALIFYQQGLKDKDVEERTNAVIKMANVTGDAASEVSSYMTAIWNNFDDGSESLEHYADVITALGASTASSSAEIAAGLEKFASVAETIGLSYDYSTAALATIVANTRQSADTVGTGLRTIFSRLQGLSLGETLDDGTDLNKYSKALKTVGVDILDASGKMKDMDTILTDLASKWENLSKAQQTALAQTVGGVRQYTNLIALMDNWGDMEQNLITASSADGSLQKQSDIYAEGWEAASKRVRAAAEAIYQDLLDDDFFIGILNGFEGILKSVHGLVEGLGGLKGVVATVGSIFLTYYAQKMPQALENLKQNFYVFTGQAKKAMLDVQQKTNEELQKIQSDPAASLSMKTQAEGIARVNEMQQKLIINSKNMTEAEKQNYQARIQNVQAIYDEAAAIAKEVEELEKKLSVAQKEGVNGAASKLAGTFDTYNSLQADGDKIRGKMANLPKESEDYQKYAKVLSEIEVNAEKANLEVEKLKKAYSLVDSEVEELINKTKELKPDILKKVKTAVDNLVKSYTSLLTKVTNLDQLQSSVKSQTNEWKNTAKEIDTTGKSADELKQKMSNYLDIIKQIATENGLEVTEEQIASIKQQIMEASSAMDAVNIFEGFSNGVVSGQEAQQVLDGLRNSLLNLETQLKGIMPEENFKQITRGAESAADATNRLKIALENGKGASKGFQQGTFSMSTALTQFGSAAMSAYMVVNSIKNTIDVFKNKSSTTLEKIGALVAVLTTVMSAYNAAQALANTLTKADIVQKAAQAVTTGTATKAQLALNAAMTANPIGLVIAAVAALVAAFIGLIEVIKLFDQPTQLEKLTLAADEAKQTLEDTTTAAQELKSSLKEYESVYDTFKNCTVGTQEWKDSMQDLNTEVDNLIEKFPELKDFIQIDPTTGALTISQEGIDQARENQDRRVNAAMLNSAIGDTAVAEETLVSNLAQLSSALSTMGFVDDSDVYEGILAAAKNGSIQGTQAARDSDIKEIFSIIQSQISEKADQYASDNGGNPNNPEEYNRLRQEYFFLNDYQDLFDENGNLIKEETDQWVDAFKFWQQEISLALNNDQVSASIRTYVSSLVDAGKEADVALMKLTSSLLSDRTDLDTAEKRLAVKYAEEDIAQRKQKLIKTEYDNHSAQTTSDALAVDTWNRYLRATGKNWKLQDNAIQGDDDNRVYAYVDDEGKNQTISFDKMASMIAAYEGLENIGVAADKAVNALSALDKLPEDINQGLRNYLVSGNLNSLSAQSLGDLTGPNNQTLAVDKDGNLNESTVKTYLKKAFGLETEGELIALLGEQYYEDFNEAWKLYSNALKEFSSSIPEGVSDAFTSLGTMTLDLDEKQSILNILENAMIQGGYEARDTVTDILKDIPKDKLDDFSKALKGIDWKTANINDVKTALDKAGLSTDELCIDLYALMDAMKSTDAVSLQSIQSKYKTLIDIVKELKTGSSIKAEDYTALEKEFGEDIIDGFFSVMADGTYQLIGNAETFYQLVKNSSQESFLNNISKGAQLNNTLSKTSAEDMNKGNISDVDTTNAAISYLQTLELTGEELISLKSAQEEYNKTGKYSQENYSVLNQLMKDHNITQEQMNALIQFNTQEIQSNSEALLSSASSFEELQGLVLQIEQVTGNGVSVYGYAEALISLASQYDNCANEIEEYQQALTNGNEATIAAAQDSLIASITIGELSKKYNLVAEDVETQARLLKSNRKELDLTEEEAARLAVANQRMNRGVETLNKNFKDWKKVLNSADHTTQDYAETLNDALDALADLTGAIDAASIPLDFLDNTTADGAKHLEWMEKAANGDIQAINLLGSALAIASVNAMQLDESFSSAFAEATNTNIDNIGNKFNDLQGIVSNAMNEIHNAIQSGMSVEEIQNKINDMGTGWVDSLNQMAIATGMSVDQMNSLLNQLGVQAQVEVADVPQKMKVPTYTEIKEPSNPVTVYETQSDGSKLPITKYGWRSYTVPGPSVEVDGVVQVAQISTEGNQMSPAIKYTGTGGSNRVGGVSPSPTPSKGGGGGGDKSSPPKHNEEKHKKPTDEKERYHVIKNQIEDLTSQYDNLSKAKDKAFGAARLNNLNKEIAAQKKLTQANKDYLSEIEKYLAKDKAKVSALGAQFDENGTITNYDALIEKAVKDYNDAVDAFNKATTDDEGAKKAFEAAQERYEEFMKTISQYEETQKLYQKQMQQILDDIMTEQSLLLEQTQLQVELKIDVSESALSYLESMMKNIENKAYDCAEAFGYLNSMTQEYFNTAEALEGGLRGLFANQGLTDEDFQNFINGDTATYNKLMDMLSSGGVADLSDGLQQSEIDAAYGFTSEDINTMKEYVSQLISANENLQEVRKTVHEQILTVWEEWTEKIDTSISKIEHLKSITESYKNIIDIVGQKNLGVSNTFMSKMRQQTVDQANDQLEAEKARYEALKKSRDDAYAEFEKQKNKGILSPEEIKLWEDSLKSMDDDVQSAAESFQSAWENALTAANEAFEAAVDQIIQAYDDAAAGLMGSMTELQDAFDRKSDISSQYLSDYEKIYQLTKLNRELENSIDSTNNTKAKAELLKLQSKINAYEEAGIEISQYQMEQLRQEYELKKAQIELEESQSAKSQVQMTRDSDGNYSYVYTANADDVAKAEQNYEDKLYQMQQSNASYINDLQSNMIKMEQDYQSKVQEIMKDTSLTAEERMVKLNELNQYYDEKMRFYMSEAELWEENSQRLYEEDWMNYAAATGYKISSEEEWLDHWNETSLSILTGFASLEDYQTNHNTNVANMLLASSDAFATWQTNIETAMQNAGTSMSDFQDDATEVLNSVATESENTKDSVVSMADAATSAIGNVVDAVVNWENQYSSTVQNMLAWNDALIISFNKLIAGWSGVQNAANSSGASSGTSESDSTSSQHSSGSTGNNGDNSDKVAGVAAAIWFNEQASNWGNGSTRVTRLREKGVEGAQAYLDAHGPNGDIQADWKDKQDQLRRYYYGSFDTGGYTGEWGLGGKFAMLHEKELVLNKEDTANFLQAIDIVRRISEMIDLNALSSAGGLSSLLAATASSSSQKLEQQVTIHAEFPNATDKDQITEAFNDLVNLASQYANRK